MRWTGSWAGDTGGTVGSLEINYRMVDGGTYCTFEPTETTLYDTFMFRDPADPDGPRIPGARIRNISAECDNGDYTDSAVVMVLGRDVFSPRGAIIVRWTGTSEDPPNQYDLDNDPGNTGPDSWVPMERGNNHVYY